MCVRVSLSVSDFDVQIYVYVNDELFLLAFPLLSSRLSKRAMIGRGETGILKPCVCYAMARLAEIKNNETVLGTPQSVETADMPSFHVMHRPNVW